MLKLHAKKLIIAVIAILAIAGAVTAYLYYAHIRITESAVPDRIDSKPVIEQSDSVIVSSIGIPLRDIQRGLERDLPRKLWSIDRKLNECVPRRNIRIFGEDITTQSIINVWENRDEFGRPIFDEDDDGTVDTWGMYLYGRYAHIEPWVFRNGGRYLNADETALELNDEAVNALQFLTDLVNVEGVAPQPQEMEGVRQQDIMALGMAAMWVDGSWNIANVRKIAGDDFRWGIAQVPMGPDATKETAAAYAWADMLSVGQNSRNPELAWAFIQHMVGEGRDASDFLGGKVPAYIEIATSEGWLEKDQQPANKGLLLDIGAQNVYTGFSKNWSGWRGYDSTGSSGMNGELDEVLNGRKSLDEAIKAFVLYGNDILSR